MKLDAEATIGQITKRSNSCLFLMCRLSVTPERFGALEDFFAILKSTLDPRLFVIVQHQVDLRSTLNQTLILIDRMVIWRLCWSGTMLDWLDWKLVILHWSQLTFPIGMRREWWLIWPQLHVIANDLLFYMLLEIGFNRWIEVFACDAPWVWFAMFGRVHLVMFCIELIINLPLSQFNWAIFSKFE